MAQTAFFVFVMMLLSPPIVYGDTLTDVQKTAILQAHNDARDLVANGCHKSEAFPDEYQPPAKDGIPHLEWDDALAASAKVTAEKCELIHSWEYGIDSTDYLDDSLASWTIDDSLPSYKKRLGENIAVNSVTDPRFVDVKNMAEQWVDERRAFNYGVFGCDMECDLTHDPSDITSCGHYTQIIWAKTLYVGCGFQSGCSSITRWGPSGSVLVCQYYIGGNMGSSKSCESYAQAPYEEGTNSQCEDDDTPSDSPCDSVPKCVQMEGFKWDKFGRKYDGTWEYQGCDGGNTPYYTAKLKKDIYKTGEVVYMCLVDNSFWKLATDPSCSNKYIAICPTNNIMECGDGTEFWRVYSKKVKDETTGEVTGWKKTKQKRVTVNVCNALDLGCDDPLYDDQVCVEGSGIIHYNVSKVPFEEFRCLNDKKAFIYNDTDGNEIFLYWSSDSTAGKWILSKIEMEDDPLYVLAECEHDNLLKCTENEWRMHMEQHMAIDAESLTMTVFNGACYQQTKTGGSGSGAGYENIGVWLLISACVVALCMCCFIAICVRRLTRKGKGEIIGDKLEVADADEDEEDVEVTMQTETCA